MLLFNSLPFYLFFAVALLFYYVLPKKCQWVVLLCSSIFFYVTFSWKFLFFIITTIITIYLATNYFEKKNTQQTLLIEQNEYTKDEKKLIKAKFKKKKKTVLVLTILLNIGILFALKYLNFLLGNIDSLASLFGYEMGFVELYLILPLGISFYTFQSVGYLVDVYWGKVQAQKNIFKLGLFVSFFPQIVQGPISRYNELQPQLDAEHKFDYKQVTDGLKLILWGLFKKIVIADGLVSAVDAVFNNVGYINGVDTSLGILFYFIQDYADFSGCIDIARGVAMCFGINLAENFRRPFFSRSVPEYWRRWHITLGTWFKDYLFYPLSISKFSLKLGTKSKKIFKSFGTQIPAIFGLTLVWLSTGIWHGASWNYILWGLYFGFIIILGIVFKPLYTKIIDRLKINTQSVLYRIFQWVRTIWLLSLGRILFRTNSLQDAWTMFLSTFDIFNINYWIDPLIKLGIEPTGLKIALFAALILLVVDIINEILYMKNKNLLTVINSAPIYIRWTLWIALLMIVIIFGNYGASYVSVDFIYMQF